jgi:hypothetical protein
MAGESTSEDARERAYVRAIPLFGWARKDVDARDKRGHDGRESDSNRLQMARLERAKGIEPSTYSLGS